jgi:hypothetical protein
MRYAPNDRRAFKHKKRRPAMKKISTVQADGKEIFGSSWRSQRRDLGGAVMMANACQRKVEMSGFSQDRNVRFHDFLQG